MKWADLKYLMAYIIPISAGIAITLKGNTVWITPIWAFGVIPLAELFMPQSNENLSDQEAKEKAESPFFDVLLFLNVPLIFGLLLYFFVTITYESLSFYEVSGLIVSIGIVLGAAGINVAHELGHKEGVLHKTAAKLLLLPSLYQHFHIEHNRGHHLTVGTPSDPATSRLNENLYAFWIRSTFLGYKHAWELEKQRLKKMGLSFYSFQNEMIQYTIFQSAYLLVVFLFFGAWTTLAAILVGIISFLLLETINYIEHYGLTRRMLESGRYERVEVFHSWNSNHEVGRIMLYELTRHSDHHYKSMRKFQILRHHDESPQLPYGYPASMLLSAIPPLWFYIMNPRIKAVQVMQ